MGPPSLEVVIVSYKSEGLLADCLSSLREHPPAAATMRVHVVDNASGEQLPAMVRARFPEVKLTVLDENAGFSAANNVALGQASADFVLVLNSDTRITPGSLDALLDLMADHPEIGMCGPRLVMNDGTFDHASRRSFPTPLSALGHFTGIGQRLPGGRLAAYRAPEVSEGAVDAINGAFMLIRREALEQVGHFDEVYWMYMEDLDLCYRFWQADWKVWYEPSVSVFHVKAGTSGRHRKWKLNYAFHYGMYRFYRAHMAPDRPALVNLVIYLGIGLKLLVAVASSAGHRGLRRIRRASSRRVGV